MRNISKDLNSIDHLVLRKIPKDHEDGNRGFLKNIFENFRVKGNENVGPKGNRPSLEKKFLEGTIR